MIWHAMQKKKKMGCSLKGRGQNEDLLLKIIMAVSTIAFEWLIPVKPN